MSLAVVLSRGLAGIDAPLVTVEVYAGGGLPGINIVGLPEAEVRESRDRVRAALQNARFEVPARKFTVNLAPADLPKESGRYDLPIALGILAATDQLRGADLASCEFAGELALTGALRPIRGALAMALAARRDGRAFVLPAASAGEAAPVRDALVLPARSLLATYAHLIGREPIAPLATGLAIDAGATAPAPDLADVRGQEHAKRALTIAATGGHSLLMIGPPGTGKSMLAQRLPGILPPMSEDDALAVATIASLAGSFAPGHWGRRPYRAPHHTASAVALVGGGSVPRPGEISLAHHGVLFLDELPEWDRRVLEGLREPLESGSAQISRAARQSTFPASFQLVAAMNPCPCGWLGHASGRCRCSPDRVARYRARVSGPLLDRLDLAVEVPAVAPDALVGEAGEGVRGEGSAQVRERVAAAHGRQLARQGKVNARLAVAELAERCRLGSEAQRLAVRAMASLSLSARACHRVLKVARTIADLAGTEAIGEPHLAEAIGYRGFAATGDG
jgi:magnesium chelatase family protein